MPVACNDDGCGGGQTGKLRIEADIHGGRRRHLLHRGQQLCQRLRCAVHPDGIPPPPNDDCSAAIPLPQSGSIGLDTVSASTTPGLPPQSCAASLSRDVWFSYTSPNCFKAVTVSTCTGTTAGLDTVLTAYTGTCGNLVPLACNDDGCGPSADTSSLTFVAEPATTYLIALHSFSNLPGGPITVTTSGSGGLLSVAGGCGSFPWPAIAATTPHVGSTFTVTVSNGGANSWGALVVAPGLGTMTTPLPGGCSILLDLTSVALFPFTTSANGTWTVSALLGPEFSCVTGKMQAVLLPPGSSGYLTTQVMAFAVGP